MQLDISTTSNMSKDDTIMIDFINMQKEELDQTIDSLFATNG